MLPNGLPHGRNQYRGRTGRRRGHARWQRAPSGFPQRAVPPLAHQCSNAEQQHSTDNSDVDSAHPRASSREPSEDREKPEEEGAALAHTSMRPANMNAFSQPRQGSRLQNTQKSAGAGLGNGAGSGWGTGGGLFGGAGGFGGLGGGAPGLGGRPSGLTGFAQVMGGGSGQGPIDMSEFPSLSGGPQPSSISASASWSSSAIRQQQQAQQRQASQTQTQAQSQQQQRAPSTAPSQQSTQDHFEGVQQQRQNTSDRGGGGGGGDDFPPLGGQLNGDAFGGQSNGYSSGLRSPEGSQGQMNGQPTQLPFREGNNMFSQIQQNPIGQGLSSQASVSGQQQPQQPPQLHTSNGQPPPASNVKRWADMSDKEKWGMPGLLAAFEARRQFENGGQVDDSLPPAMKSSVFMGQDLSALGLDLDSPDPIYPTFTPFPSTTSSGSLYDFHDRHVVPDFSLPNAYTVTNVPPLSTRMGAFSDETLFSIFYQFPRDTLQELAALELTSREWRWHKILRQWLQKDTPGNSRGGADAASGMPPGMNTASASSLPMIDLTNGAPIGTPSVRIGANGERGVFIFFDAPNWRRERREFVLNYDELDGRAGGASAATAAVPPGAGAGPNLVGGSSLTGNTGTSGGMGSSVINASATSAS